MIRARLFSRISGSKLIRARNFSATSIIREVQLFDMPSMSPTMEEGGIVEWKVKAGEKFSAGDVLLDIETDKAEISVEAADDGVLAKILVDNGAKGIPVGKPIAVLAEESDNISTIDYDSLLKNSESSKKPEAPTPQSEPASAPPSALEASTDTPVAPVHGNHGTEPLPTAARLLHEHNISAADVKGSGPFGRITKGDVLAHIGKIPKDYPINEQKWISKREKLDLSNIKPRLASPEVTSEKAAAAAAPEKPKPLLTSVSIELDGKMPNIKEAQRHAMRYALMSLAPKSSVLRDPIFDSLTAPTRPPFTVKKADVVILRGKPVSLEVVVEEPPAKKPSRAVGIFIEALKKELE